ELRRLFDGQVSGLRTLEDAVHIVCGSTRHRLEAWRVGHEASLGDQQSRLAHRGDPMRVEERHEGRSLVDEERGRDLEKCLRSPPLAAATALTMSAGSFTSWACS